MFARRGSALVFIHACALEIMQQVQSTLYLLVKVVTAVHVGVH